MNLETWRGNLRFFRVASTTPSVMARVQFRGQSSSCRLCQPSNHCKGHSKCSKMRNVANSLQSPPWRMARKGHLQHKRVGLFFEAHSGFTTHLVHLAFQPKFLGILWGEPWHPLAKLTCPQFVDLGIHHTLILGFSWIFLEIYGETSKSHTHSCANAW